MKICESCSRCPSCAGPDVWTWALERADEAERAVLSLAAERDQLRAALREACDLADDRDTNWPGYAARISELRSLAGGE